MSTATTVSYAHTIARMVGCPADALSGLDMRELDVLYFGIPSDNATPRFRSMIDYLETGPLENYATRPFLSPAERAYCQRVLARRELKNR